MYQHADNTGNTEVVFSFNTFADWGENMIFVDFRQSLFLINESNNMINLCVYVRKLSNKF